MRSSEHPPVSNRSAATEVLGYAAGNGMHSNCCLAGPIGDPGLLSEEDLGAWSTALNRVCARKRRQDWQYNNEPSRTHGFPHDESHVTRHRQHATVAKLRVRVPPRDRNARAVTLAGVGMY